MPSKYSHRTEHRHIGYSVWTGNKTLWCSLCGALGTVHQPTKETRERYWSEFRKVDSGVDLYRRGDLPRYPRERVRWKLPRRSARREAVA